MGLCHPTQDRTCDTLAYADCGVKAKESGVLVSDCGMRSM